MAARSAVILGEQIDEAIQVVRGQKVMLDSDLAKLYGVTTKRLNEQVRRNKSRFPADFMFQLTEEEGAALRSQIATLNEGRGKHRKYLPYAFTKQGVAMLSSVLHSPRAVRVNIEIMRAFVRVRQLLGMNAELARRLKEVESRVGDHDELFLKVIREIRHLMTPPPAPKRRRIGFHTASDEEAPATPEARVRKRK